MKPGDPADRATDAKADGAFQGSHRAGYGDRLARVEDWLRRHPDATLQSGEGAVLVQEIDRLRAEGYELRSIIKNMGLGINTLRAAIDRVRRQHHRGAKLVQGTCRACGHNYPCPTLRALDGDA